MSKLPAVKTLALAAGIVIVLNAFLAVGVRTFYVPPTLDDFCPPRQALHSQEQCEAAGGEWMTDARTAPVPVPPNGEQVAGWCDTSDCHEEYREARDRYNRDVFVILLIAGTIAFLVGYSLAVAPAVSGGLIFGGLVAMLIGTLQYWSGMQEVLRFVILGLVLVLLIWTGYRSARVKE